MQHNRLELFYKKLQNRVFQLQYMFRVSSQFKALCISFSQAPKSFKTNVGEAKKTSSKSDESWRKWMGSVPRVERDVKWAVDYLTAEGEDITPRKINKVLQDRYDRVAKEMMAQRDYHEW